jgi:hypothetical protein
MSKTFTTVDQNSSVLLPREALAALGVDVVAELEIEIVKTIRASHRSCVSNA